LFSKSSLIAPSQSLGLASYIYSLDGTTTFAYLTFATSAFNGHGVISAIQTAQGIIGECSLPFALFLSIFPFIAFVNSTNKN
jgi:hypothetical protein